MQRIRHANIQHDVGRNIYSIFNEVERGEKMEVFITILTLISFILILISIILTNKLINQFKDENKDLRSENEELNLWLDNAERRTTEYARKIKKIEDIIIEAQKENEFAVITLQNIKKELFTDGNQEK